MPGRRNTAEFKSILQKMLVCSSAEVFAYTESKYRTSDLASIWRFQRGCH
jgi:hypothetical protein